MENKQQIKEDIVFGLDIGTRSIVGTVGYKEKNTFKVVAQETRLHETRAMLDGQVHDIGAVSATIREIKEALEERLGSTYLVMYRDADNLLGGSILSPYKNLLSSPTHGYLI